MDLDFMIRLSDHQHVHWDTPRNTNIENIQVSFWNLEIKKESISKIYRIL